MLHAARGAAPTQPVRCHAGAYELRGRVCVRASARSRAGITAVRKRPQPLPQPIGIR
jgi:hypothetical protein